MHWQITDWFKHGSQHFIRAEVWSTTILGLFGRGRKCPYPWDLLCLKHLTIHIKHTSALRAEFHGSKVTAWLPFYPGGHPFFCRDSTGLTAFCCLGLLGWFGGRTGQNPSRSFPPVSRSPAEFPPCAPAQCSMSPAGIGHVEKRDYSVPTWKEKHWRAGKHCRLRAAAIHRLGKLCGLYLLHSC